jgi:hypothetical protein
MYEMILGLYMVMARKRVARTIVKVKQITDLQAILY